MRPATKGVVELATPNPRVKEVENMGSNDMDDTAKGEFDATQTDGSGTLGRPSQWRRGKTMSKSVQALFPFIPPPAHKKGSDTAAGEGEGGDSEDQSRE